MQCFIDSTAIPVRERIPRLPLSAALLLALVAVSGPRSPAMRAGFVEASTYCQNGTCATPDGVVFTVSQTKGREGIDATLDFAVTVDNPRSESMTVNWNVSDDYSATAGEDFTVSSGSLSFGPGESTQTVSIPIVDDSEPEVVESFPLRLDLGPAPAGFTLLTHRRYFLFSGFILPNDDVTAPTVTVRHEPLTSNTAMSGWVEVDQPHWTVVHVVIEFSEPVTGFDQSDLEFEGGEVVEISNRPGSSDGPMSYRTRWEATIAPVDFLGTMSIRVPAGAVRDSAGLANTASNTIEVPAWEDDRRFGPAVVHPTLACLDSDSSDPAVWDNPASLKYLGGHVRVAFGFKHPYVSFPSAAGLPGFNPSESMSLTDEDGVTAAQNVAVALQGGSPCWETTGYACYWSAKIRPGVTGQLTLQMLAGAARDRWIGDPTKASEVMYVAGRGWSASVADASATAGADGTMEFEVRLNARDDCKAVRVDWATADGTATAGTHYTATSGTLAFEPGEATKTVSVPILPDTGGGGSKSFTLRLSNPAGVTIGDGEATGVIVDPAQAGVTPAPPEVSISARSAQVTEGSPAAFEVTLDEAAPTALTVAVNVTESVSVLAGAPPASVSFAEGAISATLSVPTAGDRVVEANSTVTATVTAGTGYRVRSGTSASVTVVDDDAATFTVSAEPARIREGESATLTVAIANGVTFTQPQTISLSASGTASPADYSGVPPTVTLAAGASSVTATLAAVADAEEEPPEEAVTVTASHGRSLIGSATVTIDSASNDARLGGYGIDTGTDTEARYVRPGEHEVDYSIETVRLRNLHGRHLNATVTVEPEGPTRLAVGENKFVITVTAEDGTTTKTYTVTVTRAEPPDRVATIAAGGTPVTEGTAATYRVSLDQAAPEALTVAVSVTESGTVVSGTPPASVSIAKGSTNATLTVPTVGDSVVEADSTVTASVAAGTGYTIGTAATASVTVEDDDAATFTVSADPPTISEGGSATLTVAIANGVIFADAQTISLATSGTASAADYTGVPPTLALAAGATSATATLAAAADSDEEQAETVTVTAAHGGSSIGSATVTINSVSRDATLGSLNLTGIDIGRFSSEVTRYAVSVANTVETITVTAPAAHSGATVTVDPGPEVRLAVGENRITITVTAEDGTTTKAYTVTVTRAGLPVATVTAGATQVTEGSAARFTVSLDRPAPEALTVAVGVTESGSVRTRTPRTRTPPASVSIAKGASSATLTVPTSGDKMVNADSTLTARVAAGTGYTIGAAATATVTVEDDDDATFAVSAEPETISEGKSATLTVAIANGVTFAEAQTISLTTSGTASPADYTGLPPTLTLSAGASSVIATLAAAADQAEEEAETVTVTASHGGSSVGSATVTIQSVSRDATLSSLSLSGVDIGTFSGVTTTYQASVANPVTATTVTATASNSGAAVAIEPEAEVALAEGANRITVTVTAEDGTTTKTYTVTVTRASLPVVSIVAVEERLLGPIGEFRLTRTGSTAEPLEVQVLFADSRSPTGRPLTVRFRAGQASVTERVQAGDNRLVEDDLTMTWTLKQGEGYAVSAEQASASLVLEESDVPEFAVTAEPPEIAEGESATVTVAITNGVRFREAQTIDLTVSGTASGSDYTVSPSTLTLQGLETLATATLTATADQEDEAAETVTIWASHGGSAIGSVTVTINSVSQDATLSSLSLSGVDIGTFSSAVTAYQASVAHDVETTTVTATASHSGATVSIDPGATVSLAEGANRITVTVTAENGTTTKNYTVTVRRAEEPAALPVVSIAAFSGRVAEGEQARFRVTRTGSTSQQLDVQVSVTTSISSRVRTRTMRLEAGSSTSGTGYFAAQDDKVIWEAFTTTWTIQQGAGYEVSADAGAATVVVDENDVAEFALSVDPDPVAEGSSATLKLAITNGVRFAEHQAIELAVTGGTASAGPDFGLSGQSLTLRGSNAHVTARLDALDDDEAEGNETVTLTARLGGEEIATQQVTIANRKLTAEFRELPAAHDGKAALQFELWFSKQAAVGSEMLRDAAFEVTEGSVTQARQLVADSLLRWEITVQPASDADVVLTLPVPASCEAEGAICTAGGGKLAQAVTATVAGSGAAPAGFPLAPENSRPSGIWSDGETAWVADLDDARLYAYRQSDGERQPAQDIATEPAPMGLWSDGNTIWVAGLDGGLRAHRLANGARLAARDLALEANETPAGVWSDGETAWVSTWLGDRVHAYRLSDGERLASRDIKLTGGNLMPVGLWSDGETLWVADWRERLFAYRLADGQRVSQRDVSTSKPDTDPTGLWSAGGTLLSTGWGGREVRAYSIPATEAALAVEQAGDHTYWPGSVPTIGDPSLQAAIHEALGKGPGEAVSVGELAGLESLSARNSGVRDLAGLQVATNLKELDLGFNPLEDLQPLASLSALESLNLDGSALDLGPLASLQSLRRLSVRHNLLDDLQPLAALVALTELDVGDNRIEDLRALAGLAGLAVLRADRNGIADLWPLASLAGLEALDLRANRVRDLQPLAGMERLRMLRLDGNRLSELHPLSGLKGLADLGLAGTAVRSLGPIAGLDGLRRLDLRGGSMSDLRPLRGLTSLIWVHVGGSRIEDLAPLDGLDGLTVVGQDDRGSPSTGGGRAQRSKSLAFDSAGR